jgi:hypothetical protein
VLKLDDAQDFHGTIAGISHTGQTDILRLEGLTAGHAITASSGTFDNVHDTTTLTILDGSSPLMTFTLEGDYSTSTWIVTDKGGGEYDIVDPPASDISLQNGVMHNDLAPAAAGQPAAAPTVIADGATAHIGTPSSGTVTFTGGTGSLVIDDPSDFTGHIAGFTGTAPDAEHSDTIDLVGIDFNSKDFTESYDAATGALSVSDGTHSASFTFDDFKATLDFASDGNGGTLVTDPPPSGDTASLGGTDLPDFAKPLDDLGNDMKADISGAVHDFGNVWRDLKMDLHDIEKTLHDDLSDLLKDIGKAAHDLKDAGHDFSSGDGFAFNFAQSEGHLLQHVFNEFSDALAPVDQTLHAELQPLQQPFGQIWEPLAPQKLQLAGQPYVLPYSVSATTSPQIGGGDPAALHDLLKPLLTHTDFHL